ncbi:MAG: DUF1579 domain-containing protein [Phycisphaerales bacterium]|nr:DUF1579 domain-containing protein [Phycisphaerales bacterium]
MRTNSLLSNRAVCPALLILGSLTTLIATGIGAAPAQSPGALSDQDGKAVLGSLVGSWIITGSSQQPDGTAVEQLTGNGQFAWAMGSNFVGGEISLSNGKSLMGQSESFGYTPQTGLFAMTEMTSIDRAMFQYTGTWEQANKSITFTTINPLETPQGAVRSVQTRISFQDDNTLQMTIGFFEAGELDGSVQLKLARAPSPTAAPGGASAASGAGASGNGQATMTMAQMQQALAGMAAQKNAMQGQMSALHSQVSDMSRSFHDGMLND